MIFVSRHSPDAREPAPHYHPLQDETFVVLAGEMTVRLEGFAPRLLRTGELLLIPRNTMHSMWNAGEEYAAVSWTVSPALHTEYLLETIAGLAGDGRTDDGGKPPLLQTALIASRYKNELRLSKPPYWLQRIVFAILRPIARLAGYRASYEEYLD